MKHAIIEQILKEEFEELFFIMPPVDLISRGGNVSFKLMEKLYDNITTIVVMYDKQFFKFNDHVNLSHTEIIQKIDNFLKEIKQ